MKNKLLLLLLALLGSVWAVNSYGQCTPADSTTCPDPENNGQICPDSLSIGYLGQAYTQTVSILPPPEIDTAGTIIPIHHLKLLDVGNLPPGITYVSNTDDSIFMAGHYYCLLFSGVPTDTGNYALRIIVDVYGAFGGSFFWLKRVTDSTSLTMHIEQSNGMKEDLFTKNKLSFWPNPFSKEVRLRFTSVSGGPVHVVVYSLQGIPVIEKIFYDCVPGKNILFMDGSKLAQGHYIVKLLNGNEQYTGIISKTP